MTAAGRGIAVVLMLVGVGIFGLLAASLASFFVERDLEETQEQEREEDASQLADIPARLDRIEALLAGSDRLPSSEAASEDAGRAR